MEKTTLSTYFSIVEYYKKVVQPLNPAHYRIKSDKMMVCPLHDDVNPSMGIIMNGKGEELYHCFGCNRWGNVVELHKAVSRRLFKKYLSDDEALKDLCRVFNVDYVLVSDSIQESEKDEDIRQEVAIREAMDRFDIADYQRMFTEGKLKKKPIAYFNTLTMMMIAEMKESES